MATNSRNEFVFNEWLKDFPHKKETKDFFESLFELNPNNRASAAELVKHSFFDEVRDQYAELMRKAPGPK